MKRIRAAAATFLLLVCTDLSAADLVRMVRYKLSAGDLASGEAATEEYRRTTGVDAEYLDAVGWLARGAQMLGQREKAAGYAAEVRKAIPAEDPALLVPLGAAIEVEGRLRLAADGRGAALRYWETELAGAKDPSLRSRIRKNMNLVSLEGERAPEIGGAGSRLATLSGKARPALLLGRGVRRLQGRVREARAAVRAICPEGAGPRRTHAPLRERSRPQGRHARAGVGSDRKGLGGNLPGPRGRSRPVDTETMVRYGVSATPTYALVDGKGIVRLYAPTRLTEADLSRSDRGVARRV